jgi:hypothetical protein
MSRLHRPCDDHVNILMRHVALRRWGWGEPQRTARNSGPKTCPDYEAGDTEVCCNRWLGKDMAANLPIQATAGPGQHHLQFQSRKDMGRNCGHRNNHVRPETLKLLTYAFTTSINAFEVVVFWDRYNDVTASLFTRFHQNTCVQQPCLGLIWSNCSAVVQLLISVRSPVYRHIVKIMPT